MFQLQMGADAATLMSVLNSYHFDGLGDKYPSEPFKQRIKKDEFELIVRQSDPDKLLKRSTSNHRFEKMVEVWQFEFLRRKIDRIHEEFLSHFEGAKQNYSKINPTRSSVEREELRCAIETEAFAGCRLSQLARLIVLYHLVGSHYQIKSTGQETATIDKYSTQLYEMFRPFFMDYSHYIDPKLLMKAQQLALLILDFVDFIRDIRRDILQDGYDVSPVFFAIALKDLLTGMPEFCEKIFFPLVNELDKTIEQADESVKLSPSDRDKCFRTINSLFNEDPHHPPLKRYENGPEIVGAEKVPASPQLRWCCFPG